MLCIHSFLGGHLGSFHLGAILNSAAVTICAQVFVLTYAKGISGRTREGCSVRVCLWQWFLGRLPWLSCFQALEAKIMGLPKSEMSRVIQGALYGPCCLPSLPHSNARVPVWTCKYLWWALRLVAEEGVGFGLEARFCFLSPLSG